MIYHCRWQHMSCGGDLLCVTSRSGGLAVFLAYWGQLVAYMYMPGRQVGRVAVATGVMAVVEGTDLRVYRIREG